MKRGRGQSAGLTRDGVLDAAMKLVDRDGLSSLTMRRLGSELGVEAMTIYHHVPNKDALLDGLVERLVVDASTSVSEEATWQDALRGFAHAWLAALRAHPNLFPLVLTRPAVTSRNLDLMEALLHRLERGGFGTGRGLDVIYAVTGFVVGQAALAPVETGAQVGELAAAGLQDHPLLARATRESAAQQVDRFDYALEAMLAGFEGMVD
jgi:AcrR family transcriptional regulator